MRGIQVVVVAVTFAVVPAHAYRPLATEDTGTTEPGRADFELSVDVEHAEATVGAARVVVGTGITPALEVRVETGVGAVDTPGERGRAGVTDSIVGLKHRLLDESAHRPAVLAAVTVRFPTAGGREGLGEDGVDVTVLAAASKTFGPLAVLMNAGHAFVTADSAQSGWLASAAADYSVSDAFSIVSEVVSSFGTRGTRDSVVLRAGAIGRVASSIALDAAVGFGVTRGSPDLQITVGLTIGW